VEKLPSFPLMDDSARDRVFERSSDPCDCCGEARGWKYTGPVYGEPDEPTICPWCIADGSAAEELEASFNDGEDYEAKRALAGVDLDLVEHRTPGFTTWQGNHWKVCCDSACKFMGDATAEDLTGRWASLVPAIRKDMGESIDWVDDWIADQADYGSSPALYVFQCRNCSRLHFYWDID